MDEQGRIQWIFGEPPANMNDVSPSRRFGLAGGLALAQGYLFVADPLDGTIHVLNPKGEEVAQLGDMGTGDGQFNNPVMVAVDYRQRAGGHRVGQWTGADLRGRPDSRRSPRGRIRARPPRCSAVGQ